MTLVIVARLARFLVKANDQSTIIPSVRQLQFGGYSHSHAVPMTCYAQTSPYSTLLIVGSLLFRAPYDKVG